jgi:CRP-like cAMP-binding protein
MEGSGPSQGERRQLTVRVYSEGTVVGERCIVDNKPRAVTAVAREESCLAVLAREDLDRLIEERPSLAAHLLKGILLRVSIRLRKSFDRLAGVF